MKFPVLLWLFVWTVFYLSAETNGIGTGAIRNKPRLFVPPDKKLGLSNLDYQKMGINFFEGQTVSSKGIEFNRIEVNHGIKIEFRKSRLKNISDI